MDVEEEDRLETWVSDAESSEAKGKVQTARAIFAYALKVFPDKKNIRKKPMAASTSHHLVSLGVLLMNIFSQGIFGCHSEPSCPSLSTGGGVMAYGSERKMAWR
jgi:hypothetical protein